MLMSFIRRNIPHNASNLPTKWTPRNRLGNICKFSLLLTVVLVFSIQTTTSNMSSKEQQVIQREFAQKSARFAVNLFNFMHKKEPLRNIIYSPFSIQTCVGMARIGATGETAAEIDRGLGLPSNDVAIIADTFHNVLSTYEGSPILKIANKIFIMEGYSILKKFNEIAATKFFSSADSIDFGNSVSAASTINKWVESKTNNLIKDLISPDAVNSDTRVVLVNAIHFKGEWKYQFPKTATREDNFYLNEVDSVKVPMMNLKESFAYGIISELDAAVLEMPYKDSDLSMVVILPNSRTGLSSLQEKLKNFDLTEITHHLFRTKVIVKFPKFKAEFDIQLNDALINLGMSRMFSGNAEFDKMLDSNERLQVSKVVHKAFIEVNEEGTEAAAATGAIIRKKRGVMPDIEIPEFHADHPFIYIMKHSSPGDEITPITLFFGTVNSLDATVASDEHDEL